MPSVDKDEVAKYYILCELDNIVAGNNIRLQERHYSNNLPRLLEALSFTFRTNSVFDYLEGNQYRWEKRLVAVDNITLTGMGEELTEVIYSPAVQRNPLKFVQYIQAHQAEARFAQLQPQPVPDNRNIILLRESEGTLKLLDGSHRFLAMFMNGASSVNSYVAVLAHKDAPPMIGDAVFIRLRNLWLRAADPTYKSAIEQTVRGMIGSTENGLESVRKYWVVMAPNEQVKLVGQRLVADA